MMRTDIRFHGNSGKGFFDRPPAFKSSAQGGARDTQSARPCSEGHGFAVVSQHPSPTAIVALFEPCCPSAVSGPSVAKTFFAATTGVMAVVVNTVDAGLGKRLQSHIGQKVDKGRAPAIAYCDTSSAIEMIITASAVVAAVFHACQCRILRRLGSAACPPVKAAARFPVAFAEIAAGNCRQVSAITLTYPAGFAPDGFQFDDCQPAVDVASLVFDLGRQLSRIARSHLNLHTRFVVVRAGWKRRTSGRLALLYRNSA